MNIQNKVHEAIKDYNKYRGIEAQAELIKIDRSRVLVKIEGILCYTCGFYDWIEDLKYELEEKINREVRIEGVLEERPGRYIVALDLGNRNS